MGNTKAHPELLKGAEVAAMFRVNPKTVYRWTKEGKLPYALKTPGRQYRYSRTTIELMIAITEGPGQ